MQEDNSMSDRILDSLERIIRTDRSLKEFSIVPTEENKNKSPVLYIHHNLGLESWCVKHVYRYAYSELFKVRHLLRKNRLPHHKMEQLNKFLLITLLIQPDVNTFWNMKRELVEFGVFELESELLLTKLVLSHKSKSNEAFAYRKWLLKFLMRKLENQEHQVILSLLENELVITEMAAEKSQNNYHAWTHRIWCLEFFKKYIECDVIMSQIEFSLGWIFIHVSEYSGYYYRQYLLKCVKENKNLVIYKNFCGSVEEVTGIKFKEKEYLQSLLGNRKENFNFDHFEDLLKNANLINYVSILLYDLFVSFEMLFRAFPIHESVWYYRRFVIYNLLKCAYEYHGLEWKTNAKIDDSCLPVSLENRNIVNFYNSNSNQILSSYQDNGEKCPKLPKYEPNEVDMSYLYTLLIKSETKFISENISQSASEIQRNLAYKYEKWLRFVIYFNLDAKHRVPNF